MSAEPYVIHNPMLHLPDGSMARDVTASEI